MIAISWRRSLHTVCLVSALAGLKPLAMPSALAQSDPTYNGVLKAVNCEIITIATCSSDVCAPMPNTTGQVSFDFANRTWQSPPLRGPTGPLSIANVSLPVLGKPLRTDFSFEFNHELGQLRVVMIATNNNSSRYSISLAARSRVEPGNAFIVWAGSCQVDPFAR